jgi:hypothetical protein
VPSSAAGVALMREMRQRGCLAAGLDTRLLMRSI